MQLFWSGVKCSWATSCCCIWARILCRDSKWSFKLFNEGPSRSIYISFLYNNFKMSTLDLYLVSMIYVLCWQKYYYGSWRSMKRLKCCMRVKHMVSCLNQCGAGTHAPSDCLGQEPGSGLGLEVVVQWPQSKKPFCASPEWTYGEREPDPTFDFFFHSQYLRVTWFFVRVSKGCKQKFLKWKYLWSN